MAERVIVDAGYGPEKLDPTITSALDRLAKCVSDVERIRGAIEPQLNLVRERLDAQLVAGGLPDSQVMSQAERLIDWLEKYARVAPHFTKIVDEATRLRSFLAGGSDSRPDLSSLSDSDLAKIVRSAASGLSDKS